jgi:hypothetical protein
VFLRQYARGECRCRVARQYRYNGLRQDRSMIQFGGYLMHGRACHTATGIERPLVCV